MKIAIIISVFLVSSFISCSSASNATKDLNPEDYRLPRNVAPIQYEVLLVPNFETDTFAGNVVIYINILEATSSITLHSRDLKIYLENINFSCAKAGDFYPTSIEFSEDDRQFFIINLPVTLESGDVCTCMIYQFEGILHVDHEGFYLAKYTNEDGEVRKLATTQFQPTAARRAFPCFDEPAIKAFFKFTIMRPHDYISITNTELSYSEEVNDVSVVDFFQQSHNVMSTYLVAIVVADFKYVQDGSHRVLGRPQFINEGRGSYALSQSKPLLYGIEDIVNVDYSWPKMDQVGIPDDYFWAGAMENWGLVTYRESLLLYKEGLTSSQGKQNIILIMAHEYGHKWFGNLVTPDWWNVLWVSEGFASYFDYFGPAIDTVEPGMEMDAQFAIRHTQNALRQDSAMNTTPMRREISSVSTPAEVMSMFNFVVYPKAASVIRMVEQILTTPVFRLGLTNYLETLQYTTAISEDLYRFWQEAVDSSGISYLPQYENVSSVMLTWELNAGYPLLTISRNYATGNVNFEQRRFLETNVDDPSIWSIPISYSTTSFLNFANTEPLTWLLDRFDSESLDISSNEWLIVNNQQSGYFRVNYDITNWYLIISYLNTVDFDLIHRNNRAQLIDDSFTLARFGVIDYFIPLDLSLYLIRETDFIPLWPYFQTLSFLDIYMQNSAFLTQYRNYFQGVLSTAFNTVGLSENSNDSHLVKLLRPQLLHWICRHGHLSCRFHSLTEIRNWRDNGVLVPPNVQTVYACSALRVGNQGDFDFLYNLYLTSELQVRERMIPALGCAENEEVLENYLNIILAENSTILSQDRLPALNAIHGAGSIGLEYFYSYFKQNYGLFRARFSESQFRSIVNSLANRFTTEAQLQDFREFSTLSDAAELFETAINNTSSNVQWGTRNVPRIGAWLTTRSNVL
ncbi:aminopeptidase N-like [Onthophagus taurus]|uniref:aminopeptidase N-like n=1 Tax=Onthophagus taurus TaxID=166361 RepID=UPI0039BDA587